MKLSIKRFIPSATAALLSLVLLTGCGSKEASVSDNTLTPTTAPLSAFDNQTEAATPTALPTESVTEHPLVGSWKLILVTVGDVSANETDLANAGTSMTMHFLADGTGTMDYDGTVYELTWNDTMITTVADGASNSYTLSDDLLTLTEADTSMVFTRTDQANVQPSAPSTEEDFTITLAASSLELVPYTCNDFSINIPQGFVVEASLTESGMYHTIHIYDPDHPLNQILFILKAEPIFPNEENRSYYAAYIPNYALSPVLTNPSTEGFFSVFSQYVTFMESDSIYSGMSLPHMEDFTVVERFDSHTDMSAYAISPSLLRASFTQNGMEGEGMFTADVIPFGIDLGAGYYMAYNIVAITAEKDTFQDWENILTRSLNSLNYSQSFTNYAMAQSNQSVATSNRLSQAANEMADTIMSSWESRNTSDDIMRQKQSDATLGYERVIDTETGDIYKAENGFTDIYTGTRYQPITDDQYTDAITGYIEWH